MTDHDLANLLGELRRLGRETEWVEFKVNNSNPDEIGEYISALSNGAASVGKPFGYLVWGVDDVDHAVVGTKFDPFKTKVGNEDLEPWLARGLTPRVGHRFLTGIVEERPVVILEISRASSSPTQFLGKEHIRVGSSKRPLKDHPQIERELWKVFSNVPFELDVQLADVEPARVLELLDWEAYFAAVGTPVPTAADGVLAALADEQMVQRSGRGGWNITNLGAICLARDLRHFGRLRRKALRIVRYNSSGKTNALGELEIMQGYVRAVPLAMEHLAQVVPHHEVISGAVRSMRYDYPLPAVREIMTNGLIHQDLTVTGAGPMLELFTPRIDMTNPGAPLVDVDRFIDSPPKSRNEALASFMRRIGYCEERGSGIDNVMIAIEGVLLPAPEFRAVGDNTVVLLHGPRTFNEMSRTDRLRAVYLHACLHHVRGESVTNTSVRDRFGLVDAARTSRLIGEAIKSGLVKVLNPDAGRRYTEYAPYWA